MTRDELLKSAARIYTLTAHQYFDDLDEMMEVESSGDEYVFEYSDAYARTYKSNLEAFTAFPDAMLRDIDDTVDGDEMMAFGLRDMIGWQMPHTAMWDYVKQCVPLGRYGYGNEEAAALVAGLYCYGALTPIEDDNYPDLRKKQAAALIAMVVFQDRLANASKLPQRVIHVANIRDAYSSMVLTNDRLVDLILRRPDEVKQMMEFIEKRCTDDADLIADALDFDNPVLVEGIL